MNNAGFYKKQETEILYAPNIVEGPSYLLIITDKDDYDYPVDGWIYANSFDDAISYFAANNGSQNSPFDVQPENIKLATNREDEAEFSKFVTLLNLNLQQNKLSLSNQITIWDYIKQPHHVTVERFLEIMADYGMHCYMQRKA
jgi:hypothetical protein